MQIIYFLPKHDFFTKGAAGRTSHANGFVEGLRKNEIDFLLVSGPGYKELYGNLAIKNFVISPKGPLRVNAVWLVYSAFRLVFDKRINSDTSILIVRYSTSVSLLTSLIFKVFWKGTTAYELNSIGYHQTKLRSKRLLQVILAIERRIIAMFDVAVCVSNNLRGDVEGQGFQCFVLPNGSSAPAEHLPSISRTIPRFVYLGSFATYYNFEQLFRCFLRLENIDKELHMYGSSREFEKNFPEYFDHRDIHFKGKFDLGRLLGARELSRKDIFILPNGRNRMARIGSPTKLFEYLSFGARVVYQDYGQAKDVLNELSSTYPYWDDESLTRVLKTLATDFDDDFDPPFTEVEYQSICTWEARVRTLCDFFEKRLQV